MAVWWMTEAIPLSATALLPIVLIPIATDRTVGQAAAPYASSIVFLFLGGFLIAIAMEKWNLHLRIALLTLRRVGLQPRRMVLGLMLAIARLYRDSEMAVLTSIGVGPRRLLRPALSVGAIYLAARAITTVFLLVGAEIANRTGGGGATGSLKACVSPISTRAKPRLPSSR